MTDETREKLREIQSHLRYAENSAEDPVAVAEIRNAMDDLRAVLETEGGGREITTLGDFIRWMKENDLVVIHRGDSAPREGEDG